MAIYATRAFHILGHAVAEDASLAAYPRGTQRWLTERGLASTSTTFKDGNNVAVNPNSFTQEGFRRQLKLKLALPA